MCKSRTKQVEADVPGPGRIYRVLAIQLEPDLLAALVECSAEVSMTVSSEPCLEQGYWACLSEMPDVVVVGAQTSTATAMEVLSRLKAHPLCKHIPLLAIAPSGEEGEESLGGQAAEKFLTCPVDLEEAKCALRALFEQVDPHVTTHDADAILPSTAEDDSSAGSRSNRLVRAGHEGKPRERPLVLAIDDDPDISAAIALRLSTYSVDVLPAFAGMPGYWTAVDMHPDVILCDLRMPDGEGNYIVGRLRSHPLTQDIPIIITDQDNPGTRRVMLSMGVAAYFNKPIVMKDLIEELRRYILLPRAPRGPLAEDSGAWLSTPIELKTV
jgi:DNA-binding response OmpR family regulator